MKLRLPPAPGLALAALLVLAGPPAARAAEGPAWHGLRPVTWTFARVAAPVAPASAMRVERDPDTGLLVPAGPAAAARLAAPAAQGPARPEPRVQVRADGSLMLELDERHMHDFAVTRGPDGRLRVTCAQAHEHDPRATAPAAAWPEE